MKQIRLFWLIFSEFAVYWVHWPPRFITFVGSGIPTKKNSNLPLLSWGPGAPDPSYTCFLKSQVPGDEKSLVTFSTPI